MKYISKLGDSILIGQERGGAEMVDYLAENGWSNGACVPPREPLRGYAIPARGREDKRVRASAVAAVLGISKWMTARDAFYQFVEERPVKDKPTVQMKIGTSIEEFILRGAAADAGAHIVCYEKMPQFENKLARLTGSPDGIAQADRGDGKGFLIEIKNTMDYSWQAPPPMYYCQVQMYLYLTGLPRAEIWALHCGSNLVRYPIARDDEFIDSALAAIAALLDADVPPAVATEEDARRYIRDMTARIDGGHVVELSDPTSYAIAENLWLLREKRKGFTSQVREIDKEIKLQEAAIIEAMGGNGIGEISNPGVVGMRFSIKVTTSTRKSYTAEETVVSRLTIKPLD